ncbi:hypothetical protein L7F22_066451 [Adiantum nelumboides]|nr:hypothetical protein [Adiantum nelumboides]
MSCSLPYKVASSSCLNKKDHHLHYPSIERFPKIVRGKRTRVILDVGFWGCKPRQYFVWSAAPVNWSRDKDVKIWQAMLKLTNAMCWKRVAKLTDKSTGIGASIFKNPTSNYWYENRKKDFTPMCDDDDKPDAAWSGLCD